MLPSSRLATSENRQQQTVFYPAVWSVRFEPTHVGCYGDGRSWDKLERSQLRPSMVWANFLKKSSDIFFAAASIKRDPIAAIGPPI